LLLKFFQFFFNAHDFGYKFFGPVRLYLMKRRVRAVRPMPGYVRLFIPD
jgi:hypothetical protein